ncbi:MAG TPA: tetratricopeptide repeat protein [Candidatus Polarisedimenticolia bacterium]|nr:tetratricopeptide repeat protein [Candidatus Polarisedimenticolia bacterium]
MLRRTAGILSAAGLLALSLCSVADAATSVPAKEERWIEVRTAHFTLFSGASRRLTLDIGSSLELFRDALTRLFSGLEANAPIPTFIYIFKDESSFRPYKTIVSTGPARVTGTFVAHRDGNYVAIDATRKTDPWHSIYHEYVHYFLNNNFTDIPQWFNEGTAECLSTFWTDGVRVEIGLPIDEHVAYLKSGRWIQLPTLFAIDAHSKDYREGTRQATFYSESWALVHYLAWGRKDAKARGIGFFAQFPPRSSLKDVLDPILGPDRDGLQGKILDYVRHADFDYDTLDMKELEAEAAGTVVPMSYSQTLTRLGDYLLRSQDGRTEDAQAHFEAAIQADPSHAPAYAGMGYVRDLQKRSQDAAGFYEKALALDPGNALTLFLYAESLMQSVFPAGTIARTAPIGPASPETARARELYKKTLRLRPDMAEAYVGLGATYTFADQGLAEGIAALEKARGMLPSRMDVVLNLASLYARTGEDARARDLVERVLDRSGDREMIAAGREILVQIELKEAQARIDRGELDGGVAIIEAALAKTSDAGLKKHLEEQLAAIEKTRTLNRQVETYNRAVNLANSGDYKKAAAILEQLAAEVHDPGLAQDTRTLLKRVRQAIASGSGR